jgi:4-phospho-D-threonate 3-dehydrogenase / 4-phospho-D-erythronate 3-dehydrogenase
MVKSSENIVVGISIGDINGIGCEVILKALEDSRMLEFCTPVLFGNVKTISHTKKIIDSPLNFQRINTVKDLIHGKINVINVWNDQNNSVPGIADEEAGKLALLSLEAATNALKESSIDVLVTAPINKKNIQSEKFQFPGHTDYLEKELGGNALMFMIHDEIKVGLLTDHVPVNEVSQYITEKRIRQKVFLMINSLTQDFSITKPKIALLGLNPHCGDNGVIGTEDDTVIKPTINALFEEGHYVFGPFSADSFFGSKSYKKYDAVLAAYHDQGLIPFKTLSFGEGVNYTAGLSKVRTSPDHGTAYEIAGQGSADATSFREAIYKAIDIFKSRSIYEEISAEPLQTKK